MVRGLEHFRKYFLDYADRYVLIGGTACSALLNEKSLDFRATKDLDLVLVIEALDKEFARAFWDYIQIGKYKHRQQSDGCQYE